MSSSIMCPLCGNEQFVRKASSIVQGDTAVIKYAPPGSVMGYAEATTQSQLARKLSPSLKQPPPLQTGSPQTMGAFLVLVTVGFLALGITFISQHDMEGATLAGTIFLLCGLFTLYIAGNLLIKGPAHAKQANQARLKDLQAYERAKRRLSQLYYCYHHDIVFIDRGRYAPISQINRVLYD